MNQQDLQDAIDARHPDIYQIGLMRQAAKKALHVPERADSEEVSEDERSCHRSACKTDGAEYWNPSTQKWYCQKCANRINEILEHPLCWHIDRLPDFTRVKSNERVEDRRPP